MTTLAPRMAEIQHFGTIEQGELIAMDCQHLRVYLRRTLTAGPVRIYLQDPVGVKGYVDVVKPGDELFRTGDTIAIDATTDPIRVTSQRYAPVQQ